MFKLFHPHFLSKHIPWKFQLKFFYDSYDPQTTTFMITSMIYHEMSRPLTFSYLAAGSFLVQPLDE